MPAEQLTIVIPAHNAAATLPRCLEAIRRSHHNPAEVIVVDDGSTDRTAQIAEEAGAIVLGLVQRGGPAMARNLGAEAARYDLLLFLDSDVEVGADTIGMVISAFVANSKLAGLIGSYDFSPSHEGFVSQYRNLMHSFHHQHGKRRTTVFWGACGAIRKAVFFAVGGFDDTYKRPSIEDIELGSRLNRHGALIELHPEVQVKHLKQWTLAGMIRTDVLDRAIPWTRLILRDGEMPNDLNVKLSQRFCVALMMAAPISMAIDWGLAALCLWTAVVINWRFYFFLGENWGWSRAMRAVPLHLAYFFYSGIGMGIGTAQHLFARRSSAMEQEQEL